MTDQTHISPDGMLRFAVSPDEGDLMLGFEGMPWHTHGDMLVGFFGDTPDVAIGEFVRQLLANELAIVLVRVSESLQDIRITFDPSSDLQYRRTGEVLEFRFWDGRPVDLNLPS